MVSVIRNLAKNRVVLVKQFVTIPSKQYEEMKTYAAENPIMNEGSDDLLNLIFFNGDWLSGFLLQ